MNIIENGEKNIRIITKFGSGMIIKKIRKNIKYIKKDTGLKKLWPGNRRENKFMDWEKKIEIVYDKNQNKREVKKMTDEMNDEKKFSKEEIIVNKYLEDHKGENISYRDAVLACLGESEKPVKDQEKEEKFSAYVEKQKKDLEAIEKYIEKNPGISYSKAVKIVLGKVEQTREEILVEEYIESHENCSYKTAVLAVLDTTGEIKKKE